MIKDLISFSSTSSKEAQTGGILGSGEQNSETGMFGAILNSLKQGVSAGMDSNQQFVEENEIKVQEEVELTDSETSSDQLDTEEQQNVNIQSETETTVEVPEDELGFVTQRFRMQATEDVELNAEIEQNQFESLESEQAETELIETEQISVNHIEEEMAPKVGGILSGIEKLVVGESTVESQSHLVEQTDTQLSEEKHQDEFEEYLVFDEQDNTKATKGFSASINEDSEKKNSDVVRISKEHKPDVEKPITSDLDIHEERTTNTKREPNILNTEETEIPIPEAHSEPNPASGIWNSGSNADSDDKNSVLQQHADNSGEVLEVKPDERNNRSSGIKSDQEVEIERTQVTVENYQAREASNIDEAKPQVNRPSLDIQRTEGNGKSALVETGNSKTSSVPATEETSRTEQDYLTKKNSVSTSVISGETQSDVSEELDFRDEGEHFERTILSLRRQDITPQGSTNNTSGERVEFKATGKTAPIPLSITSEDGVTTMMNSTQKNTEPIPVIAGGLDMDSETIQTIQNIKVGEVAAKEQKLESRERSSEPLSGDRIALSTENSRGELHVLEGKARTFETTLSNTEELTFSNSSVTLTAEQEALLAEYMVDEQLIIEPKSSQESSLLGYMRLGEMPITNVTARRNIVTSFAQAISQAKPETSETAEVWQKHNFELEDGNSIELTTRSVDGVIQIKMAASSSELNRLLQQHLQEIKDHLEQELGQELDLQFDQKQEGELSQFFDQSSSNGKGEKDTRQAQIPTTDHQIKENSNPALQQSIRKFGYNQMEWIA